MSPSAIRASRAAIAAACRRPEGEAVAALIDLARLPPELEQGVRALARRLALAVRSKRRAAPGVDTLMREFALSSREGIALMCLAEALLRIPDRDNADRLIRDKLATGDWHAHLGAGHSLFVNAVSWGLLLTGRLLAPGDVHALPATLGGLLGRGGEPLLRGAMDLAMRLLGEHFVIGRHIGEALAHARGRQGRGYRHSFDMLGEAALNAADAQRYFETYEYAIHAIGAAQHGRGVYDGAGISVKLSALHPRYALAQRDRVMAELLPRLQTLAGLAARYRLGFTIDAEESERLELSLDLFEALLAEPSLAAGEGLGIAVQAYQKRAAAVVEHLLELARASGHRLMVRLVKGAYWDSEIKRAQVDGVDDYPVFTRKAHTDVAYLACARRLLEYRDRVFPQFATHNARTLATIHHLAGHDFSIGDYEYQCLHGMGEDLYDEVIGRDRLDRPCRIYAPVGSHASLLAYLVRRLLENGANSSFVNQVVDETLPIDELIADPVEAALASAGAPHPHIVLPAALFGAERTNSRGLDFADAAAGEVLEAAVAASRATRFEAQPHGPGGSAEATIRNPADRDDCVGVVVAADAAQVEAALTAAAAAAPTWAATSVAERAAILERAAALLEADRDTLVALLVREAGKTLPAAVAELREAVDHCRYYAARIRLDLSADEHRPIGPVACISPWNFPLAIFVGQVAAALAAGNSVLAKPAAQTPLVAARAVGHLHAAGVPGAALQFLPGRGETVGTALVGDGRVAGVMFTGSTEVARDINTRLAERGEVPLVAETGGQNCMIVDSSALPEQVVADVLASAFDSAGQRCSALRVLCLQEEVAEPLSAMLQGALAELRVGDPARLATDIGPVIDAAAAARLEAYVERMAAAGRLRYRLPLAEFCRRGSFVAPALVEIFSLAELEQEVFGPVLHILRYSRERLESLLDDIAATGYGLTLGIHSRIGETIDLIVRRARVGNIYVNRNMIGAVVGVQPFGGEGLSGTGPKAGGPLTVHRLLARSPGPRLSGRRDEAPLRPLATLIDWLRQGCRELSEGARRLLLAQLEDYWEASLLPLAVALPGPVGEDNTLSFAPRGTLLGFADSAAAALHQLGAALATGNRLTMPALAGLPALCEELPPALAERVGLVGDWRGTDFAAVLQCQREGAPGMPAPAELRRWLAQRPGPLIPIVRAEPDYDLSRLLVERVVSVNTAAAGGNASLLALAG